MWKLTIRSEGGVDVYVCQSEVQILLVFLHTLPEAGCGCLVVFWSHQTKVS
jgi:hypothetical protein